MNTRLIAAALACAAVLSVACGRAAPTGSSSTPESPENDAATKVTGTVDESQCQPGKEPWRSPGPPKRGGTLAQALSAFDHLDPVAGGRGPATNHNVEIYNRLLQIRGCTVGDNTMVASLAKSWDVSADGKTWTLHLRDDVKWHNLPPVNGRQFTSADVGWSIDYIKKSPLASFWDTTMSHEEPDAYTVVLHLSGPDPELALKLAQYTNVMLPHEVQEQYNDFKSVMVGTGAFQFKSYKPGQEIVAERNPSCYEQGVDGKALPYVDEVKGQVFADYSAEVAAMRSGQLDIPGFSGYRKLDWDSLKQAVPKGTHWGALQTTYNGIWFNWERKPFDDVRLRQAVSLAINRDDLIASNAGGAAISGFVPAAFTDFTWSEEKLRDKFKQDVEKAKQLVAQAGYKPGELSLTMPTANLYAQDAEVAQQALAAIGIQTRIDAQGDTFNAVLQKGDFAISSGIAGGAGNLVNYFMSDFIRTGSSKNFLHISDPEIDRLAAAQSTELDPVKRKQLIDQLQDREYEIMPYVPTVSRYYYYTTSCRTKNIRTTRLNQNPEIDKNVWIDPTGC